VVEFQGTIDEQLLIKAQRVQIARLVPFLIMIALSAVYSLASAKMSEPATWGIPVFFLLLAVFLLVSPNVSARRARKTSAALQAPISGLADEQHFVFHSVLAQVDIPWEKMYRVTIRPDVVLLYPSAGHAFVVGRQFFTTDASWAEFCHLAAANVRHTPTGQPILRTVMVWAAVIVGIFVLWSIMHRP
jgi:hypothetical protein